MTRAKAPDGQLHPAPTGRSLSESTNSPPSLLAIVCLGARAIGNAILLPSLMEETLLGFRVVLCQQPCEGEICHAVQIQQEYSTLYGLTS